MHRGHGGAGQALLVEGGCWQVSRTRFPGILPSFSFASLEAVSGRDGLSRSGHPWSSLTVSRTFSLGGSTLPPCPKFAKQIPALGNPLSPPTVPGHTQKLAAFSTAAHLAGCAVRGHLWGSSWSLLGWASGSLPPLPSKAAVGLETGWPACPSRGLETLPLASLTASRV